jgi:AraC-like DNA-binding protein
MRKRTVLIASLLLLATAFCHARALTIAEADTIIMILSLIVILLLVLGVISLHYNKVFSRRNEQLHRILNALDDYRAIVGDGALSLDEQEDLLKRNRPKPKSAKAGHTDESQTFFVKMDARVNKEKPFTNPDFNQQMLAEFMEIDLETFRKLVPRYSDPDRTLDYINSLRAEYAAKILMEHLDCSMDEIADKCGFTSLTAFNNSFKFAFGITPTDYLNSMNKLFKKEAQKEI